MSSQTSELCQTRIREVSALLEFISQELAARDLGPECLGNLNHYKEKLTELLVQVMGFQDEKEGFEFINSVLDDVNLIAEPR